MNLLTQSSLSTYHRCPRQYLYRYEYRLSRERTAQPLRFGSAYHLGLELRAKGEYEAIEAAAAVYRERPAWADPFDWAVEEQTLRAMLAGYFWRYPAEEHEIIATESNWQIPLENPDTRAKSRHYALAGKIDKIIRLADGRLAIQEYKTCGEDISDESDYWSRLRCDAQISAYVYATRARGYEVETVIYDVTRKPEIAPKLIPVVDGDGCKIVLNAVGERVFNKNGKPRESASTADGWTVKSERESPEVFGARLLADIGSRPDFYYARREIARLQSDLDEFAEEVWQQSQQLHQSRRKGLWFRNVSPMTCNFCQFKSFCLQNIKIDPASPPSGFVVMPEAHAELTGELL